MRRFQLVVLYLSMLSSSGVINRPRFIWRPNQQAALYYAVLLGGGEVWKSRIHLFGVHTNLHTLIGLKTFTDILQSDCMDFGTLII